MSNIELIQKFQTAMAAADHNAAFELVAEDAVWHSDEIGAPWSGIHHGLPAIKKHYQAISGTTKDFTRYTKQWLEQGDLVIEIGGLSCILAKTDEPFATEYVCIYEVAAGKITHYRIFEDSLKLHRTYFAKPKQSKSLQFTEQVANLAVGEMAKIIRKDDIEQYFPAPSPGAVNVLVDNFISVGMVKTAEHKSYPHRNDVDEVHYVIAGQAKFRHGNNPAQQVQAGDIVYVRSPEEHEWSEASADFELLFVQAGPR